MPLFLPGDLGVVKPRPGARVAWGDPLTTGLRHFWLLNEGGGTKVFDYARHRHMVFADGNPTWTKQSDSRFPGPGINFNAAGNGVQTNDSFSLGCGNDFTAMWRQYCVSGGSDYMFGQANSGSGFQLRQTFATGPLVNFSLVAPGNSVVQSSVSVSPGTTHTLAWTSKTASPNVRHCYIDGVDVGTTGDNGATFADVTSVKQIGSRNANPMTGVMYWLAIWARVLTPAEIWALYINPWTVFTSTPYRRFYWLSGSGVQLVSPSGIASSEALGTATVLNRRSVLPGGIASSQALGSPYVKPTVGPSGIASSFAAGNATVVNRRFLSPDAIASSFAAGTAFIQSDRLNPTPILTSFAAGNATVVNRRFVSPSALASSFAAGGAFVANRRFLNPTGIPSSQALGVPLVAGGAILPTGIPTSEALGTPAVKLQQRVTPSGIASALAFGTARVGHTTTLLPGGIASSFAAGTAKLVGSKKYVLPFGIGPGVAGIPTVVGGNTDIALYLSGENRTELLERMTAEISSQTIGRWVAYFELYHRGTDFSPALGQQVMIQEGGLKLFAGCIQEKQLRRPLSTAHDLYFSCTAVDKNGIFDRRVIKGNTYKKGTAIATVIADIVATSLDGEGITLDDLSFGENLGNLDADEVFNFVYVSQGFDRLAQISGTIWFSDVNGSLHFSTLDNLPDAPFGFTETSKDWRSLVVRSTLQDYRNVQYAVSNRTVLPGANESGGGSSATGRVETFTWTAGQPGIINQNLPILGDIPVRLKTSLPIGNVLSITVNGHAQTVIEYSQFTGQSSTGPNDYVFFYLSGQQECSPVSLPIPSGATVIVDYIPQTTNTGATLGTALAPSDPISADPLGGCGSGKYENALPVQDVFTQEDLNAIAAAELAKSGGVPTIIEIETDRPGLMPGQMLTLNIPNVFLMSSKLLITGVRGVSQGVDLGYGCSFRWTVTAHSNTDPGNWIKWFERLVGRTSPALPVVQYEVAPFVLAASGSSLAGGNVETNPYLVKRTGRMVDLYASFAIPPVNQDLILSAFVNGIFLGSVTVPANSAANAVYRFTFPTETPRYVFAGADFNDVITVSAAYRVIGAHPVKAANGSFDARWAM